MLEANKNGSIPFTWNTHIFLTVSEKISPDMSESEECGPFESGFRRTIHSAYAAARFKCCVGLGELVNE